MEDGTAGRLQSQELLFYPTCTSATASQCGDKYISGENVGDGWVGDIPMGGWGIPPPADVGYPHGRVGDTPTGGWGIPPWTGGGYPHGREGDTPTGGWGIPPWTDGGYPHGHMEDTPLGV